MLRWQVALALIFSIFVLPPALLPAQAQPPSDRLLIDAAAAFTWNDGKSDIMQLSGPVTIRLDRMELKAASAVIWLSEEPGLVIGQERAEIALIGDVVVSEPSRGITRSGDRLLVNVSVRGDIRLSADQRLTGDQSKTPLFLQAAALRAAATTTAPAAGPLVSGGESAAGGPAYRSATRPMASFRIPPGVDIQTVPSEDGTLTLALSGNVSIFETDKNGDYTTLQAHRAVVFTHEKMGEGFSGSAGRGGLNLQLSGAYLEGDVRITHTPRQESKPEQRLWAQRVYYNFDTSQAILTDAVVRSVEPGTLAPITIRAAKLRQLSIGEYSGEHVDLSTSSFATPTYSVKSDRVYVKQDEVISDFTGLPESRATFVASGNTLRLLESPVFYVPQASGSVDEDPFPLREIDVDRTKRLGTSVTSEWGIYELAGKPRPPGVDLSFLADYFSRRGPATGLNGQYSGSNINQDTNDLTDFNGQFKSFVVYDRGDDEFGGDRSNVDPPDRTRGRFLFEHQQFLPDHWQAQLRLGYSSDPTFLEEYNYKDFYRNQPYDAVAYLKRQQDTEAITLLGNADTNRFVTTSDQQQEQFDVEKLPEVGYRRIGDSLADDKLTFYSENTADRLRFAKSHVSLDQQGFVGINPGLPSQGYTGTDTSATYRGDSRQELDYPVQLGQIKMVPFGVARATSYSDSPSGDPKNRVFGAAGVRFTTDFWKIDNTVQSDLFDLYRMRHIIEPEVNLYTSGATTDRSHLFIYDEDVDGISDVSAADIAIHQRWETYRGAPGRQKSVEFLSLNVSLDAFTNPPKDPGLMPEKFRGIYFPSDPEASIPRDAINSDVKWLVSNGTAVVGDAQYDVDHAELATAAFGLAAQRYDRLAYYLGLRYIQPLRSDIATFAVQYQLSTKYSVEFSQGYDFGLNKDVDSEVKLQRRFDRLTAEVGVFHNSATGDSGFNINVYPEGFGPSNAAPDIGSFFSN